MKQIDVVYNELNNKDKGEFISACFAKKHNYYGVPRLIIKKNKKIKSSDLTEFFNLEEKYFKEIDDKYFSIIDQDIPGEHDFEIIFDPCQLSFIPNDELYNFLPEKLRKKFNISLRHNEKQKFILSNSDHIKYDHLLVTKAIKDKLNKIWSNKWSNSKSYLNDFDFLIIDNIC